MVDRPQHKNVPKNLTLTWTSFHVPAMPDPSLGQINFRPHPQYDMDQHSTTYVFSALPCLSRFAHPEQGSNFGILPGVSVLPTFANVLQGTIVHWLSKYQI